MQVNKFQHNFAKKLFFLFAISFSVFLESCNQGSDEKQSKKVPKVGILQNKPQEWADALKLGFTDGLVELGYDIGNDLVLVPRSATGDPLALTTIAKTFAKGDYAMIYSLGTQSTQEIFNLTKEKPIIFGAVTDPLKAGFFKGNLKTPLANITGTQDLWPYPAQFKLIKELLPNVKKIGIVYSSSEVNSQVSVDYIKAECEKYNIQLEERTVTAESEIQLAVSALLNQDIDLFFIPADNTAQTASPTIIALCERERIPVFTGISGIVESGAIATVGTNYYELGKVNAKQAAEILFLGKQAKDVSVSIADKGDIYINIKAAKILGIKVPQQIIDKAFKVYE